MLSADQTRCGKTCWCDGGRLQQVWEWVSTRPESQTAVADKVGGGWGATLWWLSDCSSLLTGQTDRRPILHVNIQLFLLPVWGPDLGKEKMPGLQLPGQNDISVSFQSFSLLGHLGFFYRECMGLGRVDYQQRKFFSSSNFDAICWGVCPSSVVKGH